jgi:hypothetical protein
MTPILRRFNLRPRQSRPARIERARPGAEPSAQYQRDAETGADGAADRLPTETVEAEAVTSAACLGLTTGV